MIEQAERWAAYLIAAIWYGVALPLGGVLLVVLWVLLVAVPEWARVARLVGAEMRMTLKRQMR